MNAAEKVNKKCISEFFCADMFFGFMKYARSNSLHCLNKYPDKTKPLANCNNM
jgi:hypothetical protein